MQTATRPQIDFDKLFAEIEKVAEIAECQYNPHLVRPILQAYKDQFNGGVISLRTTTKPAGRRELDVRYIDVMQPHDPYQMALDHGFLTEAGYPTESLMREIQQFCPVIGYGVDTSTERGFTKIWTVFREGIPANTVLNLPSIPPAARKYANFFAKHGLRRSSLVAIDFVSRHFNIYFMFPNPALNPPDRAANLITGLGFNLPSKEELALFSKCAELHFTFSWNSPTCERLSFVVLHTPRAQFPTHLHPMFPRLFDDYRSVRDQTYASIQSSYSKMHGDYLKIELDYSGIAVAMRAAMDHAEQI